MKYITIYLLFITSFTLADKDPDFIDHMINDIIEIYGPKNAQPKVDPKFINQMSKEQWTSILKRWYGLDEDYINIINTGIKIQKTLLLIILLAE